MIGVGGFARHHLNALLALEAEGRATIVSVAEPNEAAPRAAFAERGRTLPAIHSDYRALLDRERLDAVTIGAPLHLHAEMILDAIARGCPVFVEKPPVVSIDQWRRVNDALRASGLSCEVDFQTLLSQGVRDLKRWIVEGRLGEVRSVVAYSHQKRYDAYYERAQWAGRIRLGDRLVRDGSVNNPMAHQLHNALFFASREPRGWAQPIRVRGELYRAHPIETEDTTCMEIDTREGAKVFFYTTLCSKHHSNLTAWHVTGSDASAVLDPVSLRFSRGGNVLESHEYNDAHSGTVEGMLRNFVQHLVHRSQPLLSPFEKMLPFVSAVEGLFLSSGEVREVPGGFARRFPIENSTATEIDGIDELIQRAAGQKALFSELGVPWAPRSKPFEVPGVR